MAHVAGEDGRTKCDLTAPRCMAVDTVDSDKGLGVGILFGLLAVGGAVLALLVPSQDVTVAGISLAAWGFAVAMVASIVAVVAIQALWD